MSIKRETKKGVMLWGKNIILTKNYIQKKLCLKRHTHLLTIFIFI